MKYLEGLNEAQKEAVCTTQGPVLVIAGAGSGKTKTIAHRIVHIVNSSPSTGVLAVTFTNKAAREMRDRTLSLMHAHITTPITTPTVSTFHALSAQLLREFSGKIGISRHFTISDRSDSLRIIKHALRDVVGDDPRFEPRSVLASISRAKGDGLSANTLTQGPGTNWFREIVGKVWERYDAQMSKDGTLDFDDLLVKMRDLLAQHTDVLSNLHNRWQYIHIDEYQDTNSVQYQIARLLAGARNNLFCVGDVDQNIYTFRGATIDNILQFEREFPNATIIRLEENYRSTGTIVSVANEIIKKNRKRLEKTSFTQNPAGETIDRITAFDERDEATQIADRITNLHDRGVPYRSIALLYRANFQSRSLEEALLAASIPYRVLGTKFFDRKEIRDTVAYLRAAMNPASESDIRRIINEPARGIGKISIDKFFSLGRDGLPATARSRVDEFFVILSDIKARIDVAPTHEAVAFALERSGISKNIGSNEEDVERLENIKELVSLAATRYGTFHAPEGMERLLEDVALLSDQDELDRGNKKQTDDAVVLMTVHAAKGLEFPHVFITGLEDGLFPHNDMGTTQTRKDEEEERRLFYVALTRAKEKLHLSYALMRTVFGKTTSRMPSEFLLEISDSFFDDESMENREVTPRKVVYLD